MTEADDLKRNAPGNRTIQVDALADVQLLDASGETTTSESDGPPPTMSLPPPLPRRGAEPKAPAKMPWGALIVTVIVTGALGALGAHCLLPHPAPATSAPAISASETAPAISAEPEAEPVRRIELTDHVLITADEPDAGE